MNPAADTATILIVDDEPANLDVLKETLAQEHFEILVCTSGESALKVAERGCPDLVLLDVRMPGLDGFSTCRALQKIVSLEDVPILFITASNEMDTLKMGFEAGGVDYIAKPFRVEEVLVRVKNHLRMHQLNTELKAKNVQLQKEIDLRQKAEDAFETADSAYALLAGQEDERWGIENFIGKSPTMQSIFKDIRKLQQFPTSVLITGESGTGKELVARALYSGGITSKGRFIAVNCSAIPESLMESAFFGHVKGAFSGAHSNHKGYFELADGGTLFLDEIGEMPWLLQSKLLRVLEDGEVQPVGGTRTKKVQVRVIAASNVLFEKQMEESKFRKDLFFRLARFQVQVPPLRERRDDIPILAEHFLSQLSRELSIGKMEWHSDALKRLMEYNYPGNVRELRNMVERAIIETEGRQILPEDLHFFEASGNPSNEQGSEGDIPLDLDLAESMVIKKALGQSNGNIAAAARLLGIHRAKLYRKVKSFHHSVQDD